MSLSPSSLWLFFVFLFFFSGLWGMLGFFNFSPSRFTTGLSMTNNTCFFRSRAFQTSFSIPTVDGDDLWRGEGGMEEIWRRS